MKKTEKDYTPKQLRVMASAMEQDVLKIRALSESLLEHDVPTISLSYAYTMEKSQRWLAQFAADAWIKFAALINEERTPAAPRPRKKAKARSR